MASFKIGSETIQMSRMTASSLSESKSEIKERIAFEKTLATTPDYKAFRSRGESHDNAIWLTMKAKGIIPKAPFKDKAGKEIKWFSLTRLSPALQTRAKKYWK